MLKLLHVFVAGIFVSFIGAIPLGTQNIAAMQITISDGVQQALFFSLGLIIVDVFYIYLALRAMQWIQSRKRLFNALEWITLLIVFSLAASNFYAALQPAVHKNVFIEQFASAFCLGLCYECTEPLANTFLGWLEQRVIFKRHPSAPVENITIFLWVVLQSALPRHFSFLFLADG